MATVNEVQDNDSGVASPEATPEGQIPLIKKGASITSSADNNLQNNSKTGDKLMATVSLNSKSENKEVSLPTLNNDNELNSDDEDEYIDESIAERLWGLTEMFPSSIQSASSAVTRKTISFIKGAYQLSRQVVWVGVSSSIILFAPVMFEVERFNVEEMVKQDRNRLVLGPGSAMSGPPGAPGLVPPPTR